MPIVTISRELGSEGTRIAEAVSAQLGAPCIDKEMLVQMAKAAGVQIDVMVEAEERLLARPVGVSDEMRAFWAARRGQGAMSEAAFVHQLRAAIEQLAQQETVVFVGRAAQIILQNHSRALHVHLFARPEVRVGRIQQRRNLPTPAAAERIIKTADEQRRNWYRHFFSGVDWKNPKHYHLLINTGRIAPELAVSLIIQAAQSPPAAGQPAEQPATSQ